MEREMGSESGRDEEERIGGYLVGDIQSYVDEEVDQYLERFEELEAGGHRFNWASALFCERWLAFRLMWKDALSLLAVSLLLESAAQLALGLIPMTLLDRIRYSMMAFAAIGLLKAGCMGRFGDWIYWRHVKGEIDYWRSHSVMDTHRAAGGGTTDRSEAGPGAEGQAMEVSMVEKQVVEVPMVEEQAMNGQTVEKQAVEERMMAGQVGEGQDETVREVDEVRRKLKEDGGASMGAAALYCLVQWVICYALSLVAPSLFWYMRVF